MAKEVINSLQVFRGLAALAVVVHHASVSTDAFVAQVPAAWLRAFDLGAFGVDFFFVLSGFIIMHAHMHEAAQPERIPAYLFKRLTRIFPAYWPVGLAVLGLYVAMPSLSASGGREFSNLSSVLLLPADSPPALSVAWTLVHELMFYAVFLLWFASRRAFWGGLLLWLVAMAVAFAVGGAGGWLRYPLGLLNVEFMLGVLAALVYRRGALAKHAGTLIAGGGLLAGSVLVLLCGGRVPSEARLLLALGLGVLMLGFAIWERQQALAWPALLLAVGNASYSIYLVHNPLLSLTQRVLGRLEMHWSTGLLLGVLMAVALGYLYFLLVERPALTWLRRRQP